MRFHPLPLPILAVVVGLAACGGGSNDKDEISKIVREGGKNPASICDHLEAKTLEKLGGRSKCLELAKGADTIDANVKIDKVSVDGDKATVNVTGKDGKSTIKFVKQDGDWKVTA